MAAWRYEISLLVLKKIFQSKKSFVSPRGHVTSSIYISNVTGKRINKAVYKALHPLNQWKSTKIVKYCKFSSNKTSHRHRELGRRYFLYSYFEKGCRKKCTRQSQKVLWVFWVHCSSKKFKRLTREAMYVCLRVLKESNKSRFDSYSVRNSVLIISPISFRVCHVHIFSDNLSRNSCISLLYLQFHKLYFFPLLTRIAWLSCSQIVRPPWPSIH